MKVETWRAVASSIPWLSHETTDGTIDVTGRTSPERGVAAFVDLCRDAGLWFIARPGPFVMAELKTRPCLAQGNRLLDYYLLAGGVNPQLDTWVGDGNDRIGFTGERYGTAAPVGPLGERGLTFEATARGCRAVSANAPWQADMDEERDDLAMGLVLDSFMTEYRYPGSATMGAVVDDLAAHRGPGGRTALWRSLLFAGYRFGAVDLQSSRTPLPRLVALASGAHLDRPVQERLTQHVTTGGRSCCSALPRNATSKGASAGSCWMPGTLASERPSVTRTATSPRSADSTGPMSSSRRGSSGCNLDPHAPCPVLMDAEGRVCGVEARVGAGRVVVLAVGLPSIPVLFIAAAGRPSP